MLLISIFEDFTINHQSWFVILIQMDWFSKNRKCSAYVDNALHCCKPSLTGWNGFLIYTFSAIRFLEKKINANHHVPIY